MKKFLSLFLVIVVLLSNAGVIVSAKETDDVNNILEWMNDNGTSRIQELEAALDDYYVMLEQETDPVQIHQHEQIILSAEETLSIAIIEDLDGLQPLAVVDPYLPYKSAAATIKVK